MNEVYARVVFVEHLYQIHVPGRVGARDTDPCKSSRALQDCTSRQL